MVQQLLEKDWDKEKSAMKGSHDHSSYQHHPFVLEHPWVPPALEEKWINTAQILGCKRKHRRVWGCWDGTPKSTHSMAKKNHGKAAKPGKEPARNRSKQIGTAEMGGKGKQY